MADRMYTQRRNAEYRGPTTSDDYNTRIEENQLDLSYLYNVVGLSTQEIDLLFSRFGREHYALTQMIEDLENRLLALEDDNKLLTFTTPDEIDTATFDGTAYEVAEADRCAIDRKHGIITLPKSSGGDHSQIKYPSSDGKTIVPPDLDYLIVPDTSTAEAVTAIEESSDFYYSILERTGRVWERNILVDSPHMDGAVMDIYLRVPGTVSPDARSNMISIDPYPGFGADLISVEYATGHVPVLQTQESYVSFNSNAYYSDESAAIGWVPPGGWSGDEILNAGPKAFYFDPTVVGSIKIRMRTNNYTYNTLNGKNVYTYGLSDIDIRNIGFETTGTMMVRLDAPAGRTVSTVDNVLPKIWNVSPAELPDIFSYRIIWETSFGSGNYTLTPVALSKRVWVEVTLNTTSGGGTPALSGLSIEYT